MTDEMKKLEMENFVLKQVLKGGKATMHPFKWDKRSWYNKAKLSDYCSYDTRCEYAEENGNCESCETIDGRWITAVNDYASTCDHCSELAMHESMLMHEQTQLGLCDVCQHKGITIEVFDEVVS